MDSSEANAKLDELLARATRDQTVRDRLLADPRAALASAGLELPSSIAIELCEVTESQLVIVLPPVVDDKISDSALETATGGAATHPEDRPILGQSAAGWWESRQAFSDQSSSSTNTARQGS